MSFQDHTPKPLRQFYRPRESEPYSKERLRDGLVQFTKMAVRPRCCPCGSPVYNRRETSREWLFTHANCTQTAGCNSGTNTTMTRTRTCPPFYPLSSHRTQFTDSDSEHLTNMPAHPLRASQFYQKKPTHMRLSNPPLSVRNVNAAANSNKRGETCKHGLVTQLLTIAGPRTTTSGS